MSASSIKLPADLDRTLTELAKARKTTRAKVLREALQTLARKTSTKTRTKKRKGTIAEVAGDLIGSAEGPGDLSSNPKYMAGYGR
jgi:predicted transcriptional regulator